MSHYYKNLPSDQIEQVLNNFLISSWSYTKVSTFTRNEKAFEMQYVYGLFGKKSSTQIAGTGYHEALKYFFECLRDKKPVDLPTLETIAFSVVDDVLPAEWKISKTNTTVEACVKSANESIVKLLRNFETEKGVYIDDVAEVIGVEFKVSAFLSINGVDIPLPCTGVIDLALKLKDGRIVIVDHKSKSAFTDDKEIALAIGPQAITYVKLFEEQTGLKVDEVWFVENKISQNKDKSPQLSKFAVTMDDNARRLYEALLYEPLRKMIQAVQDPDYVYLINHNDNYVDMAELYDFWCKTMISEVSEFNVEESKKELVAKRLQKIRDVTVATVSPTVIKKFKENASKFIQYDLSNTNMSNAEKIEHVLRTHNIQVNVAHQFSGYSSDTYLLEVSAGVMIASIYKHRLDLAAALNVSNIRMSQELAVYEGRSYLSIDFSKKREKTLFWDPKDIVGEMIPIGKDNFGNTVIWDLNNHSTPHMLVCGSTGSGKSAFLRSIVESVLSAGIRDVYIMDPKFEFVNELQGHGINIYSDIDDIELQMAILVEEMQGRVKHGHTGRKTLIIFDEFADAVANARKGKQLEGDKSLEENLRILLQKGRSTGYRIIAATQRASVKVITGDAKVNFPVQVCFRVPKEVDSKVVIDEPGAESLAGYGDGLIKSPQYTHTIRFQSYFVGQPVTA